MIGALASRIEWMKKNGHPDVDAAIALAKVYCFQARRDIKQNFKALWANDDDVRYSAGVSALEKKFEWLELDAAGFGEPVNPAADLGEPETTAAK